MKKDFYQCEMCKNKAYDTEQLRKENWLQIDGNLINGGVKVWLDKPRDKGKNSHMIHVGYEEREYHFCNIDCLVKALKGDKSI